DPDLCGLERLVGIELAGTPFQDICGGTCAFKDGKTTCNGSSNGWDSRYTSYRLLIITGVPTLVFAIVLLCYIRGKKHGGRENTEGEAITRSSGWLVESISRMVYSSTMSIGSAYLKNPLLVDAIVQKAGINSTDMVLEIGPGTGNLTKKLLEAGKSVIAVELDSIFSYGCAGDNVPKGMRYEISCSTRDFVTVAFGWRKENQLLLVNFKEWDGLVRMCFTRKNKTLGAIFKQKRVLSILEKNYKTLQALQASQGNDNQMATDASNLGDAGELSMDMDDERDDVEDDDDMEMDDTDTKSDFKDKVMDVLKQGKYEDKRSSKLAQADFMHLLSLFNQAGIHFS
ncbi:ribosomal RNA small subunit methyltransferase, partial [Tanacetum coccineum]